MSTDARYDLYLMLGTGRVFEPTDRTAALDRMDAASLRRAAAWFEERCPDARCGLPLCMCHAADELHSLAGKAEEHGRRRSELTLPIVVRRVDTVIEPDRESGETETIVGCIAEDGRPVALVLDDVDRRKLVGALRLNAHGENLTDRLAVLYRQIRQSGGNWSSRRVERVYGRLGIHVRPGMGRKDLRALARSGHVIAHGPDDGRFYTLPSLKDGASCTS